ncbi:hypothetical protein ACFPYJ_31765 [Paenibacillus solisilvae]|uniref:Uncharacterized protein n=1 Tax=Paenibacillus solisilvae TaxID=2486751 RepID=A0ABW0W980_9BACL
MNGERQVTLTCCVDGLTDSYFLNMIQKPVEARFPHIRLEPLNEAIYFSFLIDKWKETGNCVRELHG